MHGYDGEALERVLREYLGETLLGESKVRLCIPSFEGEHSEVFVFKTPHHRDFKMDWRESMVKVAISTSAAPTYFRPLDDGGYRFVDGGVWANNPVTDRTHRSSDFVFGTAGANSHSQSWLRLCPEAGR